MMHAILIETLELFLKELKNVTMPKTLPNAIKCTSILDNSIQILKKIHNKICQVRVELVE